MIVLDTNVVSEPMRPAPSEAVRRWIISQRQSDLFTTTITEAEMFAGVALLPAGKRREALFVEFRKIFDEDFGGRILPFDSAAAREFGPILLARRRKGRPIMEADAQIAAIVRANGAALATRDVDGFQNCGFKVINPWTA